MGPGSGSCLDGPALISDPGILDYADNEGDEIDKETVKT